MCGINENRPVSIQLCADLKNHDSVLAMYVRLTRYWGYTDSTHRNTISGTQKSSAISFWQRADTKIGICSHTESVTKHSQKTLHRGSIYCRAILLHCLILYLFCFWVDSPWRQLFICGKCHYRYMEQRKGWERFPCSAFVLSWVSIGYLSYIWNNNGIESQKRKGGRIFPSNISINCTVPFFKTKIRIVVCIILDSVLKN